MSDQIMGVITGVTLSGVVEVLVKILLVMLCVMSLLVLKQVSMMNKVVNIPIANWFRVIAWGYFSVTVFVTAVIFVI